MKFSQIQKGRLATTTVRLPLVNAPQDGAAAIDVGIRVLSADETADVLESAAKFARARGVSEPKPGDPLYELGIRVHTCLLACFDPESPAAPDSVTARFFASAEEIISSQHIGRDGIGFLYESQEAWQDHCSPQPLKIGAAEWWSKIEEVAKSEDPLAFVQQRPVLQWSLARFMARLLLTSQNLKSDSGSSSELLTPSRSSDSDPSEPGLEP